MFISRVVTNWIKKIPVSDENLDIQVPCKTILNKYIKEEKTIKPREEITIVNTNIK